MRRNEFQRQSVEINVCFRLPEEFFLFGFVSFFPFAIFYDYASFVFFCNSRSFFVFSRLCRFVSISICVYADLIFRSSRYFNCVCGACRLAIHVWDLRPAGWCRACVATMCACDVGLCGGGSLTHARAQDGSSALMGTVYYGHVDCARLLLDAGADKEVTDWVRRVCVRLVFFACGSDYE